MTKKPVEITGTLKKYWDNTEKRAQGGKNPDNVILNVRGQEIAIAVWGKEYGAKPVMPNLFTHFSEGSEINVPAILDEQNGVVKYAFDWTRDAEQPSEEVKVVVKPTLNTDFASATTFKNSKDDYWNDRAEQDKANSIRIGRQACLNTAVEVLRLATAEEALTAQQALDNVKRCAEELEKWVARV